LKPDTDPVLLDTNFDDRYFDKLILELKDTTEQAWLADVLQIIVEERKLFPFPGDSDSYIIDYVYPH